MDEEKVHLTLTCSMQLDPSLSSWRNICSEDIGSPVQLGYKITRACVVKLLVEEHKVFEVRRVYVYRRIKVYC